MTGMEVATAARYHLNPIIIVLNNAGYGTERPTLDGSFNDVYPDCWDLTVIESHLYRPS